MSIRTKFGIHGQVNECDNAQGTLGAIYPFWAKWRLGRVPRSQCFCVVIHATFWQLRNGRFSPNKCKKLQFIHKLTSSDTSKTAKITKKDDITHQHIA